MSKIYLAFTYVDKTGFSFTPIKNEDAPFINELTLNSIYSNRSIFNADNKAVSNLMLIENVSGSDGKYIYYQYLMYRDVEDAAQRNNSVFAIILAMDTLCSDLSIVNSLCNNIFHKYIKNKLLIQTDRGTWAVNDEYVDTLKNTRQQIENEIAYILNSCQKAGILNDVPVNDWKTSSPLSVNNQEQLLTQFNTIDAIPRAIIPLLQAGMKVAVSPGFKSDNERESLKKYQELALANNNLRLKLSQSEHNLTTMSEKCDKQNTLIDRLNLQINNFNTEQKKLESDYKAQIQKLQKENNKQIKAPESRQRIYIQEDECPSEQSKSSDRTVQHCLLNTINSQHIGVRCAIAYIGVLLITCIVSLILSIILLVKISTLDKNSQSDDKDDTPTAQQIDDKIDDKEEYTNKFLQTDNMINDSQTQNTKDSTQT